jgi:Leucine-rich repeat (LRR) protein
LSGNKISTLKGLENLPSLEVLHMDRQKTQQDFIMDPTSLEALGTSLKTLTLSDCKVSVLEALSLLFELEDLYMPKNQLARVEVDAYVVVRNKCINERYS